MPEIFVSQVQNGAYGQFEPEQKPTYPENAAPAERVYKNAHCVAIFTLDPILCRLLCSSSVTSPTNAIGYVTLPDIALRLSFQGLMAATMHSSFIPMSAQQDAMGCAGVSNVVEELRRVKVLKLDSADAMTKMKKLNCGVAVINLPVSSSSTFASIGDVIDNFLPTRLQGSAINKGSSKCTTSDSLPVSTINPAISELGNSGSSTRPIEIDLGVIPGTSNSTVKRRTKITVTGGNNIEKYSERLQKDNIQNKRKRTGSASSSDRPDSDLKQQRAHPPDDSQLSKEYQESLVSQYAKHTLYEIGLNPDKSVEEIQSSFIERATAEPRRMLEDGRILPTISVESKDEVNDEVHKAGSSAEPMNSMIQNDIATTDDTIIGSDVPKSVVASRTNPKLVLLAGNSRLDILASKLSDIFCEPSFEWTTDSRDAAFTELTKLKLFASVYHGKAMLRAFSEVFEMNKFLEATSFWTMSPNTKHVCENLLKSVGVDSPAMLCERLQSIDSGIPTMDDHTIELLICESYKVLKGITAPRDPMFGKFYDLDQLKRGLDARQLIYREKFNEGADEGDAGISYSIYDAYSKISEIIIDENPPRSVDPPRLLTKEQLGGYLVELMAMLLKTKLSGKVPLSNASDIRGLKTCRKIFEEKGYKKMMLMKLMFIAHFMWDCDRMQTFANACTKC